VSPVVYQYLANGVVLLHFAFVLFVVLGGLLVWRWRWFAWLHLPAVAWAVLIEFGGWLCPLTPLENRFRQLAGGARYGGDFIERYIMSLLYPAELSRHTQLLLGMAALLINLVIYALLLRRLARR
jgi:hypothetical protein